MCWICATIAQKHFEVADQEIVVFHVIGETDESKVCQKWLHQYPKLTWLKKATPPESFVSKEVLIVEVSEVAMAEVVQEKVPEEIPGEPIS